MVIATLFVGCFWQSKNANSENDVNSYNLSQKWKRGYYSSQHHLYRGVILDRTGTIFAISQKTISALARPSKLPQVDDWMPQVSEILDLDYQAIKKMLAEERGVICLKDSISLEECLKLKDMQLKGIEIRKGYKRV